MVGVCIAVYVVLVSIALFLFEPVMNDLPMFLGILVLLGWLMVWMVGVPMWIFHQTGLK